MSPTAFTCIPTTDKNLVLKNSLPDLAVLLPMLVDLVRDNAGVLGFCLFALLGFAADRANKSKIDEYKSSPDRFYERESLSEKEIIRNQLKVRAKSFFVLTLLSIGAYLAVFLYLKHLMPEMLENATVQGLLYLLFPIVIIFFLIQSFFRYLEYYSSRNE